MQYIIVNQNHKDNLHSIKHFLHLSKEVASIADLQALPAFANDALDFEWSQVIQVPEGVEIVGTELYNSVTGEFEPVSEPRNSIISKLQLLQRLTVAEQALLFFPDDNPDLPNEVKMGLKVTAKQIEMANFIDLDREDLIAGLNYLVSLGVITAQRVDEIRGISAA